MIGSKIEKAVYDENKRIVGIKLDNGDELYPMYDYSTDETWIEIEKGGDTDG